MPFLVSITTKLAYMSKDIHKNISHIEAPFLREKFETQTCINPKGHILYGSKVPRTGTFTETEGRPAVA